MSFGGEIVANNLLPALLFGEDFTLPTVDFNNDIYKIPGDNTAAIYQPVVKLTNAELTQQKIDGNGTFDVIMGGFRAQLAQEYKEGRITGAEYTKAFTALAESAMANAVQFLISRDQGFWQAATAQAQAITARVALETAKVQYAAVLMEAKNNKAQYGLTKLKLASEDAQYGSIKYNVDNILPLQKDQLYLQNNISRFQRDIMLPLQQNQLSLQNAGQSTQNSILVYQLGNILPAQLALTNEQKEVQRAQTRNHRSDSTGPLDIVTGILGEQKLLYAQQRTSYIRDSELKAAKVFMDAWTAHDVIVESPIEIVPSNIQQTSVNGVLQKIKDNNGLS